MARKRISAYDPRTIWSTNLAPLVTAARDGAGEAARTARKERERARHQHQWWRQRWLYLSATGLVLAGAGGAMARAVAKRRAAADPTGTGTGTKPAAATTAEAIRSTVESGREKVTDATRSVLHKIRPDGSAESKPGTPAAESKPGTAGAEPRNQADLTTPR